MSTNIAVYKSKENTYTDPHLIYTCEKTPCKERIIIFIITRIKNGTVLCGQIMIIELYTVEYFFLESL